MERAGIPGDDQGLRTLSVIETKEGERKRNKRSRLYVLLRDKIYSLGYIHTKKMNLSGFKADDLEWQRVHFHGSSHLN
jgi:hypothetical protein